MGALVCSLGSLELMQYLAGFHPSCFPTVIGRCLFFLMFVVSAFYVVNVAEIMACYISPCMP